MKKRSVEHASFVIDRQYAAPPAKVFAAWSDPKTKARWFVGPDEWKKSDYKLDFRVGGKESVSGGPKGGPVHIYNAIYHDIVPNERIISTYDMHMDETRISVSLTTVEFKASGSGTFLRYTEHGAFLDGHDSVSGRERGTEELLEKLDKVLRG
ncbi:MAG: polyketide cyclase [Alphaproteobacteria bacterium]|nr:polyketide cyclase [Alphaproteobacteria bacterium]